MENLKVMIGDCRESMRALEAGSVQTCVTSPPYFGLRDYGHDGQIGLEQTPDDFVATMVEVFREVHRVLADDGTLWVNLGDSYASAWACNRRNVIGSGSLENGKREARPNRLTDGLKEKDLIGIPWRVALALQADGWYLRQDIIWHKPNPMPESVRDRCTKAHEYIFMFSKSPRYYFDHIAMKEPGVIPAGTKGAKGSAERAAEKGVNARPPEYKVYDGMRNRRSVWTVQTRPFKGAHFATFPPDLIEPCVFAGSRVGDTVLDPFGGSGTTAGVALKHGRKAVLCELNPEYAALVPDRVASIAGEGWDLL
jgi:site-specific DNA-methyltransferase (adenine-specific)